MFHIALVEPEIPQNTGNISRTCAVTGSALHLVRPLGFSIDDSKLKRAGLDYWHALTLYTHDDFREIEATFARERIFLFSTHASRLYTEQEFRDGDMLVFGKETAGLPGELIARYGGNALRIPMGKELRSLNLSNAVAIVLYEALRQTGFPTLI